VKGGHLIGRVVALDNLLSQGKILAYENEEVRVFLVVQHGSSIIQISVEVEFHTPQRQSLYPLSTHFRGVRAEFPETFLPNST
jgi:hypothetical protein